MPRGLAPRSASTPVACPRTPVTGDASRKSFLESGAGGTADCFPFRAAAAGWAIQRRPSQLDDENAPGACSRRGWYVIGGRRNAAPTQGPGPGCRGGLWPPVVYRQTKQHGISQAAPVGAADPNLHRARAQWPGRRSRGHSSFARREELPAKGAPPKTAFSFLCRRGQRNPPPERRNFPAMFFPRMERTKDPRGLAPRSASTPVACLRTPLRGTLPGSRSSNPARVVQLIAFLSAPLPLAEQFADSPASWTRKARLVHAAVGAGSG